MNEIIPAKSVNGFELNWDLDHLMGSIGNKEFIEYRETDLTIVVRYNYYKFWISKEDKKIIQIGVYSGFKGNYFGIGIGSTLVDIKKQFGSWIENLDVYSIPDKDGICFELADNDIDEEWVEESAPIEAIYIYNPEEFDTTSDIVYDTVTEQYVDKRN